MYLILQWFLSALSLMIVAHIVPGFSVRSFGSALLASLVIGLVNATVGLVLKILTFPLTILTFGLFLLVINGLMIQLASAMLDGFHVTGFWPAFFGAIVLSVLNAIWRSLVLGD
ncbi:MAG TPA: phage holin family protein [Candidatus Binatia bacterium]